MASSRGWIALRFLLRSLDLRASGFALALVAVTVGASVAATALNLRADLGPRITHELRAYGPNLLVTPRLGAAVAPAGLDESWVARIERAAGPGLLVIVSPSLLVGGTAGAEPVTLHGVEFAALGEQATAWRVDGRWPEAGEDACLVGAALAARLGLAAGDEVAVTPGGAAQHALPVAGIVSTGESEEGQVLLPLRWLQEATGSEGTISLAAVAVAGGPAEVESLARALQAIGPVEARPLRQVSEAQGMLLTKLSRMMALLTAVVLLLSGMCVMTTLMSIVVERGPEIGLMRSLGASDVEVVRMLLGEATLLGVLGGAVGLAIGVLDAGWIGRHVFGTAVGFRAGVVPWVMAITVGLCWLAVVLPLRRALAVEPATALRGE